MLNDSTASPYPHWGLGRQGAMLWLMGHQGFYSTLKRKDGKGSLASMNKAGERTRSRNGITVVVLGDSTKQFI